MVESTSDVDARLNAIFAEICNQLAYDRGLWWTRAELEANARVLIDQATGCNVGHDERVMVSPELKELLNEYVEVTARWK